jgi:hypothetical protein
MSEYLIATEIHARGNVTPTFMRAAKASERFGKTAEKSFDRASRASKSFTRSTVRGMDRIQDKISGFRGVAGGILGADIIREGFRRATTEVGSFVTEAAKVESAEVVFKRFAGGLREGKRLVAELRDIAARTPFEFEGLSNVTKLLLAMGGATRDTVIPTLKMLGDVAGGNQDRFNRIAFAYGEVASNTKASFQEIRQFTNAQVPVFKQLIKQWDVLPATARKMVKEGKATFPEIQKAMKAMTKEGGMFFKGMEDASKTFEGRMSTLRDNIKLTKSAIGGELLPILKEYVVRGIQIAQTVAVWAQNNRQLIKVEFTKWLRTTEQIMKDIWPIAKAVFKTFSSLLPVIRAISPALPILAAGWIANKIALKGLALFEVATALAAIVFGTDAATAAQWRWNASQVANPIGLIITGAIIGLTVLTVGIVLVVKHWDSLVKSMNNGANAVLGFFKRLSFGLFRIFFWPLRAMIKGIALSISKIGGLLGMTNVEREFGGVADQMDILDHKMKIAAGQFDIIIAKGEEFRNVFQKELSFNIKPIEARALRAAPQKVEFGGLRGPTELPRPRVALGGDEDDPFKRLREFKIGVRTPGEEPAAEKPKEGGLFRIKLDIFGAPEGSKVAADGAAAPFIDINLLGAN